MSVCIFTTVNQIEAGMLKGALDNQNIPNFFRNYHANTTGLAGWAVPLSGSNLLIGNIEIYVNDEDAEKAADTAKAIFGENKKILVNKSVANVSDISEDPAESGVSDMSEDPAESKVSDISETIKKKSVWSFWKPLIIAVLFAVIYILITNLSGIPQKRTFYITPVPAETPGQK